MNIIKATAQNSLLRQVVISSGGTFAIRVALAGVQFTLAVVLARLLGVSDYGLYSYAMTIASLLTIPAMLGFHGYLIKRINEFLAVGNRFGAGLYVRRTLTLILIVSVVLATVGCTIVYLFLLPAKPTLSMGLFITLGALPVFVAHRIACVAITAIGRPVVGTFMEELLRPVLLLSILVFAFIALTWRPDFKSAIILTVTLAVICVILSVFLLSFWLPLWGRQRSVTDDSKTVIGFREWRNSALPFLLGISIAYLNHEIDTLMLGILLDTDAVGLYRPATRVAGLAGFGVAALTSVIMPVIARLHASGEMEKLRSVLKITARLSLLYALIVSVLLTITAEKILLLFSSEYVQSANVLRILLIGVTIGAAIPVGYQLLSMTGFQKLGARIFLYSAIGNVIFNLTLIPLWGIEGAATATMLTVIFLTTRMGWAAYKNTHIDPSVFGYSPLLLSEGARKFDNIKKNIDQ